jgi:phosphate/sulfate permease
VKLLGLTIAGLAITGMLLVMAPAALSLVLSGGLIGSGVTLQVQQWV